MCRKHGKLQWRLGLAAVIAFILALQPIMLLPSVKAEPAEQGSGCPASSLGGQLVPPGQTTSAGKYQQHVVCDPSGRTSKFVPDGGRDWPCVNCDQAAPAARSSGSTYPSAPAPVPSGGGQWGIDPNTGARRLCAHGVNSFGACIESCPPDQYPYYGNCYDKFTNTLKGDSVSGQTAPSRFPPGSAKPPQGCVTAYHPQDGQVSVQATARGWMRCDRQGRQPWFYAHADLSGVGQYPDPVQWYKSFGGGDEAPQEAYANARSTLEDLGSYVAKRFGKEVQEGQEFQIGAGTVVGVAAGTYVLVRYGVPAGGRLIASGAEYVVAAAVANPAVATAVVAGTVLVASGTYVLYRLYKIVATRNEPKRDDCGWWDRLTSAPGCE